MLPPLPLPLQLEVDKATANIENTSIPGFTNLHRHLKTHVLDDDGSTRSHNRGYEASGIAEKLHGHHVRVARRWILVRCLLEICLLDPPSEAARGGVGDDDDDDEGKGRRGVMKRKRQMDGLPTHLRELCYVVASYLALRPRQPRTRAKTRGGNDGHDEDNDNGNEADRERSEEEELMSDDLDRFHQHMPELASCLNQHLIDLEDTVAKLLEPVSESIESSSVPDNNSPHGEAGNPTDNIPYRTTKLSSQRTHNHLITSSSSLDTNTNTESRTKTRSRNSATHTTLQTSHLHTTSTTTIPTLLHSNLHTYSLLQTLQTRHLTHLIRHAELYTHGTRSRHALSHASFLNAVAAGLDLKTRVAVLERELDLYAGLGGQGKGKGRELKMLVERMEEEERELDREVAEREGVVLEYSKATGGSGSRGGRREREEKGGMEVWEKVGKEYADIQTELKEVRDDVLRLEAEMEGSTVGGARGGLGFGRDGSEWGGRRKR